MGITDSSLKFHLQNAKSHGVTQKEIAAVITHVAFYAGWPKAWAVFNLAKEVREVNENDLPYEDEAMRAHAESMVFPIGEPNVAYAQYFVGNSYLAPDSWFSHLAVEVPGKDGSNEWLEAVTDEQYSACK